MAGETPTDPALAPRPRPDWRNRAVRYPAGRGVGDGTVIEQDDALVTIRTRAGKVLRRKWDGVHLAPETDRPREQTNQ